MILLPHMWAHGSVPLRGLGFLGLECELFFQGSFGAGIFLNIGGNYDEDTSIGNGL